MQLLFYINDNLMESVPLSGQRIADEKERQAYIQGTINHVLEAWEQELQEEGLEPSFVIKL